MAKYGGITKEETFKADVFRDFFSNPKYAYQPNIDNIDFIVTEAKTLKGNIWTRHYLWAESKKGIADIYNMLTQLVLTSKKTYEKGEHLAPPYIACFDTEKIAFVPFHNILPIFSDNDVDWTAPPSNYETENFQKTKKKVEKLSKNNIVIFNFDTDTKEIKNFININLVAGNITAKFPIDRNNFLSTYYKWEATVKKSIAIDWKAVKKAGIIDGDFFLADLLSKKDVTFKDKLFVVLQNNQYKFDKQFNEAGFSLYKEVGFNDNQKAHKTFWDKYERPPLEEYWDYIINRRDLLVPADIREWKGSFFTPRQWVELSQKYIADALGDDWQDKYYIWDCAAGTGNLLAGLTNKSNIWASTLDQADVDVMKDRIKNGAQLLENNVFQFDFLNDEITKLPKSLQAIIKSEEKRKKLIIYINPPYAESASSKKVKGKKGVEQSRVYDVYGDYLGHAKKELFAQFLIRIYLTFSGCKIGIFSKLKVLQAPRFYETRKVFKAKLLKCFIVPANTFDNVKGQFPIGFQVWDTADKKLFKSFKADVYDSNGSYMFKKSIIAYNDVQLINDWCKNFREPISVKDSIATLVGVGSDFQQQNIVFFDVPYKKVIASNHNFQVTEKNLIESCIYFTVRRCIPATWLNDRDQFLTPNDNWKKDKIFQSDCLTYALFHSSSYISAENCVNHWIPFSVDEVNAKGTFESSFMYDFIHGNGHNKKEIDLFNDKHKTKRKALQFSSEAKLVFNAGKELWKYYHEQPTANVNGSLLDIRVFFQGRDTSGKMNSGSDNEIYNTLIKTLRQKLSILAEKIEPKVYEYGFLKK